MTNIARKEPYKIEIRLATPEDAAAVCKIYTPYVLETAITFDIEPPTESEMAAKIAHTLETYPFLVAEEPLAANEFASSKQVVGFSYATAFRPREAYIYAIETSVYVRKDCKGGGIGSALYDELEQILRAQHVCTANACISYVDPPDEYSPDTSRKFHERLGYATCAHIPNCGRKFDRWYGVIWMQKELGPIPANPEPFIPFSQL